MALSKKHFIAFAKIFRDAYSRSVSEEADDVIGVIMDGIIGICEEENPFFDIEKFLASCGYYEGHIEGRK